MTTPLPLRDLAEALAITGGSLAVADEMLCELMADLPGQLAAAGAALDADDWDGLRTVTHRMKGGSAMCAVPALHAAVCGLQGAVWTGDQTRIREHLAAVACEQTRLAAALNGLTAP